MEWLDANIWGIFAMPVGLFLCFGVPLVVWLIAEWRGDKPDVDRDKR
jgi:hypothetical protein